METQSKAEHHKIELVLWVDAEKTSIARAELIAERLCKKITSSLPRGIWLAMKERPLRRSSRDE